MKKRNLTAMAMAAMMIMANVSPAMMAMAEENVGSTTDGVSTDSKNSDKKENQTEPVEIGDGKKETINGDITVDSTASGEVDKALTVYDRANVTVNGNVFLKGNDFFSDSAVEVDSATVNVNGNVSLDGVGNGISATGSAKVHLTGDVIGKSNEDDEALGVYSSLSGDPAAPEKPEINIDGSIKMEGESSAGLSAFGTTVVVGGNVSAGKDGIDAGGDAAVDVKGNVTVAGDTDTDEYFSEGIFATEDSIVHVKGDLTVGKVSDGKILRAGDGIVAFDDAKVTVDGNVTASNQSVYADSTKANGDGVYVTIGGNVYTGDGDAIIFFGSNTKVIVKGDVISDNTVKTEDGELNPITLDFFHSVSENNKKGENSELAIGGTLKNAECGAEIIVGIDKDGKVLETPEIVIGEVEDINKLEIRGLYNGQEGYDFSKEPEISDEENKAVLSSIKYIVNTSGIENGAISITKLDGSRLDRDRADLYDVAEASEEIKVQIVPVSGYSVKSVSGGKATVTQNSDGSYTVLVPAGGGVDISAILEKIEEQSSKTPAAVVKKTSSGGGSSSSYSSGSMHAVAVTAGAGKTSRMSTPGSWKQNADKSWSFVDSKGETYKNTWIVSNSRWYYADANGNAAIGWVQIDGVWYYFSVSESSTDPLGSMLAGITTPDGYKLDSNGAWVK